MNRTIALTGATGFIGRTLARVLSAAGWPVRILVRSPDKAQFLAGLGEQITGSLDDIESLRSLLHDVYAVVHCAGAVRGAIPDQFNAVNVAGVAGVVRVASELKVPPRILSLSSLAAREPQLSPYAASKRQGEDLLAQDARDLQWIALRPPAVYGPGDRELLPLFQIMGKGFAPVFGGSDARFSMIHVDDLARAILGWVGEPQCVSGVFELHDGHDGGYSWAEVIEVVSRLCERRVIPVPIPGALLRLPAAINRWAGQYFSYAPMLTPGKLRELRHPDWVCDNKAFTQATGWKPKIGLEEGLRSMPGWPGYQAGAES